MSTLEVNSIQPLSSGTTVTLGASGKTFTIPSGCTISNSGTATGFGGGKIGQQIVGTSSTQITDNSGAYIDTGLTVNITPSATSSKINIIVSMPIRMDGLGGTHNGMKLKFMRDSTAIWEGDGNQIYLYCGGSHAEINFQWTQFVLDTPSTTSQITYKVQSERSGDTRYSVMFNSKPGYIVAQEILA